MSMSRKLFRPMAGQTHGRFAAFRMNGTLSYRGDTVFIDKTAPATQGQTAGVLDGKTLGTQDFLYVNIQNIGNDATTPHCHVAGVVEGLSIGDRNTTTAIPDDGVVIVQVAGVHTQTWTTTTDATAGWVAVGDSGSTLGGARALVGIGKSTLGPPELALLVGVVLTDTVTTGTRAAVTTTPYSAVWVRCGDVV